MSAFVVSPMHIATCASILRQHVIQLDDESIICEKNLRLHLALSNVISVAYRYAPEQAHPGLAKLTAWLDQFEQPVFDPSLIILPTSTSDANEVCFDDGYTTSDYLIECLDAQPQVATLAENYQFLACLNYQSCEAPDWSKNKARLWILESQSGIAHEIVSNILGNRHVWEVREKEVTQTHISTDPSFTGR